MGALEVLDVYWMIAEEREVLNSRRVGVLEVLNIYGLTVRVREALNNRRVVPDIVVCVPSAVV